MSILLNKRVRRIIVISLIVIFLALAIFNYFSPVKQEAEGRWNEYFDQYLECQSIWLDCLDIGYEAGSYDAKQLMGNWNSWMDTEQAIIDTYNTRTIVFLVLAGVSLAVEIIFIVLANKEKKRLCQDDSNSSEVIQNKS